MNNFVRHEMILYYMMKKILSSRTENIFLIGFLSIIYLLGLLVPINDNDSAHHATIALNMFLNNDPISLVSHGDPYLDKPHFQFWILQLSFILLGVTTFAYKISSLLFTCLTLFSVYKLARLIYSKDVAINATLILATSFAFLMANMDIRMDAMLTGAVTFSIWKVIEYLNKNSWKSLIFAALGAAIAFSVKGWYGVGIIALTTIFYSISRGAFLDLFKWRFLSIILFFFAFITPELISFYMQYDMHPELLIRGTTGNSGLRFILFDHFYGRMSGQEFGVASSNDYLFFFHSLLWSIIPWSVLYYIGVFDRIARSYREKTLFSNTSLAFVYPVIVIFIGMGISKFKLPQYIIPIFPLTALFLASWIDSFTLRALKKANILQNIQYVLMIIVAIGINYWAFPVQNHILTLVFIIPGVLMLFKLLQKTDSVKNLVLKGVFVTIFFWLPFNANFFPQLLSYQGGQNLAKEANKLSLNNKNLFLFNNELDTPFSFDYYTSYVHRLVTINQMDSLKSNIKPLYLFAEEKDLKFLNDNGHQYNILAKSQDFRVTRLTPAFLNPDTRQSVLTNVYLLEIK